MTSRIQCRMTSCVPLVLVALVIARSEALNLGGRSMMRRVRRHANDVSSPSPRISYRLLDHDDVGVGRQRWKIKRIRLRNTQAREKGDLKVAKAEGGVSLPSSLSSQIEDELRFAKLGKKADKSASMMRSSELGFDTKQLPKTRVSAASLTMKKTSGKRPIRNVEDLRTAVLDDGLELRQTELAATEAQLAVQDVLNHQVIQLIAERAKSKSTPGNRSDNATLAISMEGGGMRGAVSAGMASAIACLGLCDVFDSVYGSSAGSVVGTYMVSRQMCVDVYTDLLPAAQRAFVCKKRIFAALAASAMDLIVPPNKGRTFGERAMPGMNISFVLDGIMDEDHGLRPLDMKSFRENDRKQPLRIATSCVKDGKLFAKCLGTDEFFGYTDPSTNQTMPGWSRADGHRKGLFACLEASMTVPGATGPPVKLVDDNNVTTPSFDAFCFEPLPYRSAVEEGATHVLVLRSRPEGFQAKTAPGVYEKGVAPLYFRSHGEEEVAAFFDKGGQQYIYLEDMLTLEEGRLAGVENDNQDGVHVPPVDILYGVDRSTDSERLSTRRDDWNKAHLFPLTVPRGVQELPTLEQDKDQVLEAVRGGFAAAFDLLAPAIGLQLDQGMTGYRVAKLLFPALDEEDIVPDEHVLKEQVTVSGFPITVHHHQSGSKRKHGRMRRAIASRLWGWRSRRKSATDVTSGSRHEIRPSMQHCQEQDGRCHRTDANSLLVNLPGIQDGKFLPFTNALHYTRSKNRLY